MNSYRFPAKRTRVEDAEIIALYQTGKTAFDTALALGCSPSSVGHVLDRHNVPRHPNRTGRPSEALRVKKQHLPETT